MPMVPSKERIVTIHSDLTNGYCRVRHVIVALPPSAGTLTPASEYLIPQPVNSLPKGAQLSKVSGFRHCVVLVITVNVFPKPCTDRARASMHPAAPEQKQTPPEMMGFVSSLTAVMPAVRFLGTSH